MRTAQAWSVSLHGLDATLVTITANVGPTEPRTRALDDGTVDRDMVRETRERVYAAISNSGLRWPTEQVTIRTSSPALRGTSLGDLAVACAVLAADGQVSADEVACVVLIGELALDGRIRAVRGVLPALIAARQAGYDLAIVSTIMLPEADLVPGMRVLGADRLADVVAWLRGSRGYLSAPSPSDEGSAANPDAGAESAVPDLTDLVGQPEALRALEVAAAGGHHLLLVGRPGAGTTMYARRLPGLLPPLSDEQALEVTAVHSLAGALPSEFPLVRRPPFVAPHHTCSVPTLVGGGAGLAKPGAISLAHHGVLLLEEACEWDSRHLEALRPALEDGEIRLARRDGVVRYPANVQLVLTTAPCPCGAGDQDCRCTPQARRRYLSRLNGPVLDRVDIRVLLRAPALRDPGTAPRPDSTAVVRDRVQAARDRAAQRWGRHGAINTRVRTGVLWAGKFRLPRSVLAPVNDLLTTGAITARGAAQVLRVAWTLADLAGLDRPGTDQVAEAAEFRRLRP